MFRKSAYLVSFVFVLNFALTSMTSAELAGWWRLDETSGDIAFDSSGNGNDGALQGDPQWVAGKLGGALEGDGEGDYIQVPHSSSLNISDAATVALWVYGGLPPDQLICKGSGGGAWVASYSIRLDDDSSHVRQLNFRGRVGTNNDGLNSNSAIPDDEWTHIAITFDASAAGNNQKIYINGQLDIESRSENPLSTNTDDLLIGADAYGNTRWHWQGMLDDVRVYNTALPEGQIQAVMLGAGASYPFASRPDPADNAMHEDTWITLSWSAGDFAVSHDIYLGENLDDVNNATRDSELYRGNLASGAEYYIAGFIGYAYPDGLVPGTTYYWRVDEVNDAEPNSPWKGKVWSFMIPPKTAYSPEPADGSEFVDLNVRLTWTAGYGAKLHYIVFGEDFDEVSNAAMGIPNGNTSYNPGPLQLAKTYYWRVDEFDSVDTYKGQVWSFTTVGAVSGPNPADGAVDVKPSVVLGWDAGAVAASHKVYFGTDADAVANATTASSEYKGAKALGEESYEPGILNLNTSYFWRIDEVNGVNPDSPWAGNVWSFTTGNFFVIDDFEIYDANDNQIWYSWHDGLGYGVAGTDPYFAGNGTGAAVGDETTASYTEETIVHSGNQAMPIAFDNNKQGFAQYSEAEYTLTDQRNWTAEGVTELSLWFRGYPASVGSFVEGPAGTYTMTGSGADIWAVNGVEADEFHFAYKMLTGVGSIIARVESLDNTNNWAKAGVMIRDTLDPESAHAMMVVTPGSGVSFQRRPGTGDTSVADTTADITAPYWVKIERDLAGNFSAFSSANGTSWQKLGVAEPIQMGTNVHIGLAVTSHDPGLTCQAVFTNVTISSNVGGQWMNQDIGIESNDAEPLYVAVSNTAGQPGVVVHDDPAAANVDTWTEWVIPVQALADQGISLTNVDRIAIGLGTKGNMTVPGGSGKIFIDDIRLTRTEPEPGQEP